MTELPAGPSAAEQRLMLASELQLVRDLAHSDGLNRSGLNRCRGFLRHPDTVATATGALGLVRAEALDIVCRHLAGSVPSTLDYYSGIGDLLPEIPDDTSSIIDSLSS
jgi:hypothetical protein